MNIFRFHFTLILFVFISSVFAQVGINTNTPDTSAALHIVSKPYGQGILIPRLSESQRTGITQPAKGLMVYDTTSNLFYMNLSNGVADWYAINPWLTKGDSTTADVVYTSSVVTKVGIGTPTPGATLDVNGTINSNTSVSTPTLNVTGYPTNSLMPAGGIILWSGTTPPAGWALCDGNNGTPNLSGKFVIGYRAGADSLPLVANADGVTTNYAKIGNTGGETGHTLQKSEIPKHQHSLQNGTDLSTSSINSVTINDYYSGSTNGTPPSNFQTGTQSNWANNFNDSQSHSHNLSGNSGNGTADGLNNQIHENRPPYYVLAYIMKLP